MNIKQFILDFLSCRITFDEFIKDCNEEVLEYMNEQYLLAYDKGLITDITFKHYQTFQSLYKCHLDVGLSFSGKSSLYKFIYNCMLVSDETIEYCSKYEELSLLSIKSIPDYLDGEEACKYIEKEIIEKLPSDLSLSKKIKIIRQECKKLFHIEGHKIPHWAQSSEWPVKNGKPLKYLRSKKDGDLVTFIFEDVDTKEITEVEQFF